MKDLQISHTRQHLMDTQKDLKMQTKRPSEYDITREL